jgi:type II secretory pathway pseudopilin PulG
MDNDQSEFNTLAKASMPHQHGFTLFEILLSLGITALALIAVFQMSTMITTQNRSREVSRLLNTITKEATAYYKIHGNYSALNCNSLNDDCYFVQNNMLENNLHSPYGGKVFISANNARVKVAVQGITSAACTSLLLDNSLGPAIKRIELFDPTYTSITASEATQGSSGLGTTGPGGLPCDTIIVNGNPVCIPTSDTGDGGGFNATTIETFPVTPEIAGTYCSDEQTYTMAWTIE